MPELLNNRVSGLVSIPTLNLIAMQFQTVAGGEATIIDSVRDRGVGEKYDHEIPNLPTVSDLVFGRVWDEDRDASVYDVLVQYVGLVYGNAAKVRRDLNLNRMGLTNFKDVLLKGVTGPDGDTASNGEKTMLTLTFACGTPG